MKIENKEGTPVNQKKVSLVYGKSKKNNTILAVFVLVLVGIGLIAIFS